MTEPTSAAHTAAAHTAGAHTAGAHTAGAHTAAAVWVVAVDASGAEVARARLGHGDSPQRLLGGLGLRAVAPAGAVERSEPREVALVFEVAPRPPDAAAVEMPPPADLGLELRTGEEPVVVQRLAVYAVVRSALGLLLVENSDRTNAPGTWALPGGGVDPGELLEEALHREVWEETGHRVRVEGLAGVTTRHWVGRAPTGRLEDFHAVRLVYRATCDEPGEPTVHDIGGTTSAAAWVAPDEVAGLALAPAWQDLVRDIVGREGR